MSIDRITVFRLKTSVQSFGDFTRAEDSKGNALPPFQKMIIPPFEVFDGLVEAQAAFRKIVSAKKSAANVPWLEFINDHLEGDDYEFTATNQFPSGAIVISIERGGAKRFYAATFGLAGDALIDTEQVEGDFGIRVAMNICKDGDLKRVQTSIHELVSTQSERQISAGGRVSSFFIDSEREFLRRLSGKAKDKFSYVTSFSGKESLTVKFAKQDVLTLEKLASRLDDLGVAAASQDYKDLFIGYDQFLYISDKSEIENLDAILFSYIRDGNTDKVHLAIPKFFDFDNFNFLYEREYDAPRYEDISLDDWLLSRSQGFRADSSIATVKRAHVHSYNVETNTFGKSWSIYKCVVAEVIKDDDIFVLSMGQWRQVAKGLLAEVDSYLERIEDTSPEYLPSGVSIWVQQIDENGVETGSNEESAYNRFARDNSDTLYLFDRAKVEIAGEKRYEVCDLLHKSGAFVHAKRFQSGSASISHLFVQARFYADAVFGDEKCRRSMRTHISEKHGGRDVQEFVDLIAVERDNIQPKDFEVVFCVLTENPDLSMSDLPFMSRYELARTHKYLRERVGVGNCQICFPTIVLGPQQQ